MEESPNILYDKSIDIDDTLIYVLDDMIVNLGIVIELDLDTKMLKLKNKDQIVSFSIDSNGYIILKTDDYNIIDIENVESFQFDSLDDNIEISLTKDIYPNIEIIVEEKKIYEYNYTEKRESLIGSLVKSMNVYDDYFKLKNIAIISQNFMDMIETSKNIDFNHFYEIHTFDIFEKLPNWLIPICKNYKRLYLDEADITQPIVQENTIQVVQDTENYNFYELLKSNSEYLNTINVYNDQKYKSIQNLNIQNGYILKNYPHDTFRDCLIDDSCTGIRDKYNIDTRRNYKNFSIKLDDENYTSIINHQRCNMSGLLFMNDKDVFDLPFEYDNNILSLAEKCLYFENHYTILSNNIILNNRLVSNSITIDTSLNDEFMYKYDSNDDYKNDINIIYNFNDTYDKDDLYKILNKYIPNQDTIIQNYYYKNIFDHIYNYDDFSKVCIRYNLNIDNITQVNKLYINTILDKNIIKYYEYYNKNYKNLIFKSENISIKNIPQIVKLLNLRNFIHKQTNIVYQNYLYKKYIKNFTILDTINHKLVSKYDNTPLLCEHYCFQCKTDVDSNMFDVLKEDFGYEKNDGIYCKYCHEFLYHVEMSDFQGFNNNIPIINKKIVSESVEHIYDDTKLHEFILLLSNNLGVKLHDDDAFDIYNNIQNIDDNILADIRYDIVLTFQNHPSINNAKGNSEKELLKVINAIKKYTINTNILLFTLCNLYIYIQTSVPAYKNSHNISLLIFKDGKYSIDKNMINKSLVLLRKLYNKYNENVYFKYIDDFLNDSNPEIETASKQIENILTYILSSQFGNILNSINNYITYVGFTKDVYLKQYFTTFRPLNTNTNIEKIDKIVNDSIETYKFYMIKDRNSKYDLENISFLQDIKTYENTKISNILKIENLELLTNMAFLTLYEYIITCSGYQNVTLEKNNYINILIEKFYNTMDRSDVFDTIFKRSEWLKDDKISFENLRVILVDIFRYCKGNGDCTKTLKIYNHLIFNNSKLLLTNVYPKRSYNYIFIDLIPTSVQEYLITLPIIKKFYDNYCYDINKKIIKRDNSISKYKSLYIDIDFKYDSCHENLSIKTSFRDIINIIYNQNRLKLPTFNTDFTYNIENRLLKLLKSGDFIKLPQLYELYQITKTYISTDIDNDTFIKIQKTFDKIYNKIYEDTECMMNKILEYLNDDNLDIFKNIINDDKLSHKLSHIYYKNNIQYMIFIISKIKNKKNNNSDNFMISNTWKMSKTNRETFSIFMKKRRYSLLNDKYFDIYKTKKSNNIGYYKYLNDPHMYDLFEKLYQIYKNYDKYIYLIIGKKNNIFDNDRAKYLLKYIYMLSFYKIYEFINLNDTCNIEMEGNELYNNLNDNYDNSIESDNNILKNFLNDSILENIQIYNNKNWIYKLNTDEQLLQSKLSEQSENEKQVLVNTLTDKNSQERNIYMKLQNMGDSNWFKNAEIMNDKNVNDPLREEYLKDLENEHPDAELHQTSDTIEIGYSGIDEDLDEDDLV